MDVYILDEQLRRYSVFDTYKSMLWTERWSTLGDFELHVASTSANRRIFGPGLKLAIPQSHRVMEVETVEDKEDDDGSRNLIITGESLEHVLKHRYIAGSPTSAAKWNYTGTAEEIMNEMFDYVVRNTNLSVRDYIPYLQPGNWQSLGTIPANSEDLFIEQGPAPLFDVLKSLAGTYELGFRLLRNYDNSELYFEVYTGDDRTTRQSVNKPVVFSESFNNFDAVTRLTSYRDFRAVVAVFAEGFSRALIYRWDEIDPVDVRGFERRAGVISITVDDESHLSGAQQQRQAGLEYLATHQPTDMFDGEVQVQSEYTYEVDYRLGDIVEVRDKEGATAYKRVTEQIFVCDEEGERAYPTLSAGVFERVNTWASIAEDWTWSDYNDETWEDV